MAVRITTLSENTASRLGLLAEWGLSILVETDTARVLLDTGLSISAAHNAEAMRIDLSEVGKIVLSHGHPDHTGGLRDILRKTGEVEIIAHPHVWGKYIRPEERRPRYMGIPFCRAELESLGASFVITREPVQISGEIMTTGEIPLTTDFEDVEYRNGYIEEGGCLMPDQLLDDQGLIVKTEMGLMVILGCAHRGIINTLRQAQKLTGEERIHTVVGGTHLHIASAERVEQTISALKEFGIARLGVSHCTGFAAAARLAHEFGDIFFVNNAGTSIAWPEEEQEGVTQSGRIAVP
jgi:7,8-dihydropterin-6-yl-methyl-4-(beta-D-ribofuranosyl)aminobenzene 5'-phosphate synthase